MTDDEYDEIRRRIAAARTEHSTTNDDPEPADQSLDEIGRRMFGRTTGDGSLHAVANRMFNH